MHHGREAGRPGGRQPLLHARRRSDQPGEGDLPHERRSAAARPPGPPRRARPRRRGRTPDRRRGPPRGGTEQLRAPERDTCGAVEDGRDQLEPARSSPVAAGEPAPRASDQGLDLDGEGAPPRLRQGDGRTGVPVGAAQQVRGVDRRRPSAHLEPGGLAFGPEAVLAAERIRSPERGSPSKVRTTSTACSNVRGPARSPSFVTWPVRSTAMPSCLGEPDEGVRAGADLGRPPGSWVPGMSRRVWIESTANRKGRRRERSSAPREVPTGRERETSPGHAEPPGAGRDLGVGLLARHHQAPASGGGQAGPPPAARGSTCRCPARRRTARPSRARGRRPAPGPGPGGRSTHEDAVDLGVADRAERGASVEGPVASRRLGRETSSSTVPHPPHAAHRPSHWAACCPQSRHANTFVDLATARTLAGAL